jgi:hypothetical protein
MAITLSSIMFNDLKMRITSGSTPKRKAIFSVSGTSAGTADEMFLGTYVSTLEKIDTLMSSNQNATATVYTFNAGGTAVASTSYTWGTTWTGPGTIKPGTVGAFTVQGIITYV